MRIAVLHWRRELLAGDLGLEVREAAGGALVMRAFPPQLRRGGSAVCGHGGVGEEGAGGLGEVVGGCRGGDGGSEHVGVEMGGGGSGGAGAFEME